MPNKSDIKRMTVSFPIALRDELQASADKNDRPLSKEIINVIRWGLAAKEVQNATT